MPRTFFPPRQDLTKGCQTMKLDYRPRRGRTRHIDAEELRKWYAAGMTQAQIAQRLGVSRPTAIRLLAAAGVRPRRPWSTPNPPKGGI